jgi:aconitate hydratase
VPTGDNFQWEGSSTYVRKPPFLEGLSMTPPVPSDLRDARALAVLGDSITTDHISPAGNIKANSPAGKYLMAHGVDPKDFNSYGARRGNHEVMMRGTFANTRIKNQMVEGIEGGVTAYLPGGEVMPIYDAAMKYQAAGVPLVVIAGKEYGSGSSRDWAAKGTMLLGVKAVIAESYERIHRSNLVNMGVLPLQFKPGDSAAKIRLTGREVFSLIGGGADLTPRGEITVVARSDDRPTATFTVIARIDTPEELVAFSHGGILPYVLRQLVKKSQ